MKNMNSEEYLIRLEVFSIALSNGLMSKSEVIKWADHILLESAHPDHLVIELSLLENKSTNEIISTLNGYLKGINHKISGRIVLGMLYKLYHDEQIPFKKVLDTIDWLFWNGNLSIEEENIMEFFGLSYDFVEDGILDSIEDAKEEVLPFLENYKDFDLDDPSNWERINKSVENKLKNGSL